MLSRTLSVATKSVLITQASLAHSCALQIIESMASAPAQRAHQAGGSGGYMDSCRGATCMMTVGDSVVGLT